MTAPTSDERRRTGLDPEELRRLRLAVDASGEVIFMTDAAGAFTFVNPEFVRVYGYEVAEIVGRVTPRILKSGTTNPNEYADFWSQLQGNRIVRREFLNRTKDGRLLHMECSANPIVNDVGKIVGFLAVQRDVTRRREVERALREREQRYRLLAEGAHDLIFIVNGADEIEYANEVSASKFGRVAAHIIGKRFSDVFPAATAREMRRAVATVFETGTRQIVESRFDAPTGELWLEASLVPLAGEHAQPRAVMGIARDVTQRKLLERQLLQAQKMEVVGRLAGGIAHDFNNVLCAVLGYSELLQERMRDTPDLLADINEIKKAGERASRLTRQLLAFSRKQPVTRQVLNIADIVADVRNMLRQVVGEDVELRMEAATDLRTVVADQGQLEQVLLNLAVNARDAMPKGGSLTIAAANVTFTKDVVLGGTPVGTGAYVAITVRDSGCGMPPDVLDHVFEPFFTTKPVNQGTGLGLSTVYGIVKQNGGHITIESTVGTGTAVRILWPATIDEPVQGKSVANVSPGTSAGVETILLVEDEAGLRQMVRRTLEHSGYHVLEAQDVSHALATSATYTDPIHLLLTDVIMPSMNGPDLAQRLVARRPDIKVLYMSGFSNALLSEKDQRHRRIWFLAKPFTPQVLAAKVRHCLDEAE